MVSSMADCTTKMLFSRSSGGVEESKNFDYENKKKMESLLLHNSSTPAESLLLMVELRKKIMTFRDIIDLPPCGNYGHVNELVARTVKDLHKQYPKVVPEMTISELDGTSTQEVLSNLYNALTCVGDSWVNNHMWLSKFKYEKEGETKNISMAQLGEKILARLDYTIMIARKMFDVMDENGNKDDESPRNSSFSSGSYSDAKSSPCHSPDTPTSVLPESVQSYADVSYSPPLLWPLRLQAVGRLKPMDLKRLSFHMFPNVATHNSRTENEAKMVDEVEPENKRARCNSKELVQTNGKDEPIDDTGTDIRAQVLPSNLNAVIQNRSGVQNSGAPSTPKTPPSPPPVPEIRPPFVRPFQVLQKKLPKVSTGRSQKSPKFRSTVSKAPSQSFTLLQPNLSALSPPPSQNILPNAHVVEKRPSSPPRSATNSCATPLSLSSPSQPMMLTPLSPPSTMPQNVSVSPPPMLQKDVKAPPPSISPQDVPMSPPPPQPSILPQHALVSQVPHPPPPPLLKNASATESLPSVPPSAFLRPTSPPPPPMSQPSSCKTPPPPPMSQLSSCKTPPAPPMSQLSSCKTPPPPPPPPMSQPSSCKMPPPPPPPPMSQPSSCKTPPPMTQASRCNMPPPPPPPPRSQPSTSTSLHPPPPPPPPRSQPSTSTSLHPPPPPPPLVQTKASTPPPMLQRNASTAPPPPPPMLGSGSVPSPPPPMPSSNGSARPPPPPVVGLGPRKANTKLKRSSNMGNLYRILKGKVEGGNQNGKASNGKKLGASSGGSKQSMADALAEMTKRSAYFQQIEEDVKNHSKAIMEMKTAINSFQANDMAELHKFHQHVESHLEKLTDETQVLARFEDFPTKKLETLRTAAALYSKLDAMVTTLTTWKIEGPLAGLIDKVENYFNKIKGEVDALDRTKDEEAKRFKSHKINFDFIILVRIKESMVDLSSSCMELALKEWRDAMATSDGEMGSKSEKRLKACTKMLWKAFQLAFRVYTFAGGHDDRADKLSREVAHEIENGSHN